MLRPDDQSEVSLTQSLRWQEHYCRDHDAPVAAAVLAAVRRDLEADGQLVDALPEATRFGDLPGLRILAAAHRLVLDGVLPGLDARSAHAAVGALAQHAGVLAEYLTRYPQTNEVGRSRLLRIALSQARGPVRLLEIGASAGLNLRADHLPGDASREAGPMPDVVERLGCDLDPVDPTTDDGRARLTSYVWIDDVARLAALDRALGVAAHVPATVRREDAADFVEGLDLGPGCTTVLWHSAMWVYLPVDRRSRIDAALADLGRQARPDMQLWHVAYERATGDREQFALTLQAWDGNVGTPPVCTLATGTSHGRIAP